MIGIGTAPEMPIAMIVGLLNETNEAVRFNLIVRRV